MSNQPATSLLSFPLSIQQQFNLLYQSRGESDGMQSRLHIPPPLPSQQFGQLIQPYLAPPINSPVPFALSVGLSQQPHFSLQPEQQLQQPYSSHAAAAAASSATSLSSLPVSSGSVAPSPLPLSTHSQHHLHWHQSQISGSLASPSTSSIVPHNTALPPGTMWTIPTAFPQLGQGNANASQMLAMFLNHALAAPDSNPASISNSSGSSAASASSSATTLVSVSGSTAASLEYSPSYSNQFNTQSSLQSSPLVLPLPPPAPPLLTQSSPQHYSISRTDSSSTSPAEMSQGVTVNTSAPVSLQIQLASRRKVACQPCSLAKASCTGGRPCERCVRLNRTAKCVDRSKFATRIVKKAMKYAVTVPSSGVQCSPSPASLYRDLSPLWYLNAGDGRRWSSYLLCCHGKFGTAALMLAALRNDTTTCSPSQSSQRSLTSATAGRNDSVTVYLYLMNMKMTMHQDDFHAAFNTVDEGIARERAMNYLLCLFSRTVENGTSTGSSRRRQRRLRGRQVSVDKDSTDFESECESPSRNALLSSGPKRRRFLAATPVQSPPRQGNRSLRAMSRSPLPTHDQSRSSDASLPASPLPPPPPLPPAVAVATAPPRLIFSWESSPLEIAADFDQILHNDERIVFPTIIARMVAVQIPNKEITDSKSPMTSPRARRSAASSTASSLAASISASSAAASASSPSSSSSASREQANSNSMDSMSDNTDEARMDVLQAPGTPAAFVLSSASSSPARAPTPSSSPSAPLSSASVIELRCSAEVNSAYEEFFGEKQSVIRGDFIRLGFRAFYKHMDDSNIPQIQERTIQAMFNGETNTNDAVQVLPSRLILMLLLFTSIFVVELATERSFQCPVQCRTPHGVQRCLLNMKYLPTKHDRISSTICTFVPLANHLHLHMPDPQTQSNAPITGSNASASPPPATVQPGGEKTEDHRLL